MCSYISCCSLRMMGKLVFRCILRPASSMMLIMIMIMIMTMIIMMIILKGFHWHKPGSMMIVICLGTTQCQSCCAGCCLPAPIYIQIYYVHIYVHIYMHASSFIFFVRELLSPGFRSTDDLKRGSWEASRETGANHISYSVHLAKDSITFDFQQAEIYN
ncbi:GM19454 [Drosophila sechellia]|uniref:GM19454 n=1 Tax=Drosophila sechellia TaxID=7238 RepID=B4IGJ9_DROSE|nr:GM19454 [Drosophila sechellia]